MPDKGGMEATGKPEGHPAIKPAWVSDPRELESRDQRLESERVRPEGCGA